MQRGTERDADLYTLRIPDAYRADAARYVWQAGRIESGHPVFLQLELGPVCAMLYKVLDALPARPVDLQRRAALPDDSVGRGLAAHGLAERANGGWCHGPVTLDQTAAELDALARYDERVAHYRKERKEYHAFLGVIAGEDWPTTAEVLDSLTAADQWSGGPGGA